MSPPTMGKIERTLPLLADFMRNVKSVWCFANSEFVSILSAFVDVCCMCGSRVGGYEMNEVRTREKTRKINRKCFFLLLVLSLGWIAIVFVKYPSLHLRNIYPARLVNQKCLKMQICKWSQGRDEKQNFNEETNLYFLSETRWQILAFFLQFFDLWQLMNLFFTDSTQGCLFDISLTIWKITKITFNPTAMHLVIVVFAFNAKVLQKKEVSSD
jgi:hypothetical protein